MNEKIKNLIEALEAVGVEVNAGEFYGGRWNGEHYKGFAVEARDEKIELSLTFNPITWQCCKDDKELPLVKKDKKGREYLEL